MKSQAHRKRMDDRRAKQRAAVPDRLNRYHHHFTGTTRIYANVGREHPDYGLHPHKHAANKAGRAAAKS